MNKVQKGKSWLIILGVMALILALGFTTGGIIMTVVGATGTLNVAMLVGGIIMILLGVGLLVVGIYFAWVGMALVATKGSVEEENLAVSKTQKEITEKQRKEKAEKAQKQNEQNDAE